MEVIHSGFFHKEGSWVRTWKRRYFEISRDGKITYKESESATVVNGVFDISGRLNIERGTSPSSIKTEDSCSIWIQSDSTGRKLHVVLDNQDDYRKFCMGIAQACKFHNIYVSQKCIFLVLYICICIF